MGNYPERHIEDQLRDAYPKLMARVKYIQFNVYVYRDDEEAIDLCQDACLRCWEKRDDYDQTKSFNAWARKILDNIFIDKIRRNIRYREIIEDIEDERNVFLALAHDKGLSLIHISEPTRLLSI